MQFIDLLSHQRRYGVTASNNALRLSAKKNRKVNNSEPKKLREDF